jgi:hypothetical protein
MAGTAKRAIGRAIGFDTTAARRIAIAREAIALVAAGVVRGHLHSGVVRWVRCGPVLVELTEKSSPTIHRLSTRCFFFVSLPKFGLF